MLNDLSILLSRAIAHPDPTEVVCSLTCRKRKSKVLSGFYCKSMGFLRVHVQQQLTEGNKTLSTKAQVKPAGEFYFPAWMGKMLIPARAGEKKSVWVSTGYISTR